MTSNKAVVRRYIEQVLNRGDMAVAAELLASNYQRHVSPAAPSITADLQKQRLAVVRAAFPDWQLTVEDILAEGDRVTFRATIHATHQGPFHGIAPTGKPIRVSALEILRIDNGKVVEHWGGADVYSLLFQLGAVGSKWGTSMGAQKAIPAFLTKELVQNGHADQINDRGQIVGFINIPGTPINRAYLWESGMPTELNPRLAGKQGYVSDGYPTDIKYIKESYALAINNCGQIAGYVVNSATDKKRAFFLEDSGVTDLKTLGGKSSVANAINDCGQIVGTSSAIVGGQGMAFLWQKTTGMINLGTLPGMSSSEADGINNAGEIVGRCSDPIEPDAPLYRAFLWRNGEMMPLATLGGKNSAAHAINDCGQIVGESDIENGDTHACLWQDGTPTDLGTLGGDSRAFAINDRGEIVGVSTPDKPAHSWDLTVDFAVYWPEGKPGPMKLGAENTIANDINILGQVVGNDTHAVSSNRAFVWTPTSFLWI